MQHSLVGLAVFGQPEESGAPARSATALVWTPNQAPDSAKELKVMFRFIFDQRVNAVVLACALLGSAMASPSSAQSAPENAPKTVNASVPAHYRPNLPSKRAGEYFGLIWGVEGLSVKAVESGALIRFSYRVLDPSKAGILNDKQIDAFLDAPSLGVRLSIPSLEKVGQLRQGATEEAGRSYWMAFSNPRRTVKRGDHVNIVIGQFHADGLVVE